VAIQGHWPFKVTAGVNDKPMITVTYKGREKKLSAEEVSSMVLTKMRKIAEAYLQSPVKNMQLLLSLLILVILSGKPP
jgi:molecular chaperone DnaK (HSP70)